MRLSFFLALAMMLLTGCGEASDTGASPETTAEASAERESPAEKAKPREAVKTAFKSRPVPVSIDVVTLGSIDATYLLL